MLIDQLIGVAISAVHIPPVGVGTMAPAGSIIRPVDLHRPLSHETPSLELVSIADCQCCLHGGLLISENSSRSVRVLFIWYLQLRSRGEMAARAIFFPSLALSGQQTSCLISTEVRMNTRVMIDEITQRVI